MVPLQQLSNPHPQHEVSNAYSPPDRTGGRQGNGTSSGTEVASGEVVVRIDESVGRVGTKNDSAQRNECIRGLTFSSLIMDNEGWIPAANEDPKNSNRDEREEDRQSPSPRNNKHAQYNATTNQTNMWREVSSNYLKDLETIGQGSAEGRRRSHKRPKSFDFGVKLDPPTKLIENFLQKQAASGKLCLDMDMDMMEKLCTVTESLPEETSFCPVADNSLNANGSTTHQSEVSSSSRVEVGEDQTSSPTWNASLRSSPSSLAGNEQRSVSFKPKQVLEYPQGELDTSISFGETSMRSPAGVNGPGKIDMSSHDGTFESDSSADEAEVRRSASNSMNRIQTRSRLADPPPPPPQADSTKPAPKSAQLRSGPMRSGLLQKTGILGKVEEDEDDPLKDADIPESFRSSKCSFWTAVQCIAFFLIMGGLVCSLTVPALKKRPLWSMALWKWCLLVLLVFCGRLVSGWIIRLVVLILERNFLMRKRVLYFVYGLRKGVQNCLWFAFALLAWRLIFDPKVQGATNTKVLPYVTKLLNCFLMAAIIWLIKIFLVKVLASSFHVSTYFERIRESLFGQWVLETLSGPPVIEMEQETEMLEELEELRKAGAKIPDAVMPKVKEGGLGTGKYAPGKSGMVGGIKLGAGKSGMIGAGKSGMIGAGKSGMMGAGRSGLMGGLRSGLIGTRSQQSMEKKSGQQQQHGITIDELRRLNQKNISAWNMKKMMNFVRYRGIYTFAHVIDQSAAAIEDESQDVEIQSEWQAKAAAKKIFKNVAMPGARFIVEANLLRFMRQDDVNRALALFDGASETRKITKNALKDFVVHIFRERRALALSLNDTKTAVKRLHSLIDVVISVIILIVCLLVLGITTTHLLLVISSQLVVIVFIFGNTCKTVFEAIIFLFVMHPFDIGDRCVVDGNQVVVEEMNILSTLFMRNDGEKIWYPNSLLATKYIFNYYRTPDTGGAFDFSIDASTPVEKITALKEKIGKYIASKPNHWTWEYHLVVKEIEDSNRMKMQLMVNHTVNYNDDLQRQIRRSDLILEVKKMLQDLEIGYRLLPQEVLFGNDLRGDIPSNLGFKATESHLHQKPL